MNQFHPKQTIENLYIKNLARKVQKELELPELKKTLYDALFFLIIGAGIVTYQIATKPTLENKLEEPQNKHSINLGNNLGDEVRLGYNNGLIKQVQTLNNTYLIA